MKCVHVGCDATAECYPAMRAPGVDGVVEDIAVSLDSVRLCDAHADELEPNFRGYLTESCESARAMALRLLGDVVELRPEDFEFKWVGVDDAD